MDVSPLSLHLLPLALDLEALAFGVHHWGRVGGPRYDDGGAAPIGAAFALIGAAL